MTASYDRASDAMNWEPWYPSDSVVAYTIAILTRFHLTIPLSSFFAEHYVPLLLLLSPTVPFKKWHQLARITATTMNGMYQGLICKLRSRLRNNIRIWICGSCVLWLFVELLSDRVASSCCHLTYRKVHERGTKDYLYARRQTLLKTEWSRFRVPLRVWTRTETSGGTRLLSWRRAWSLNGFCSGCGLGLRLLNRLRRSLSSTTKT